MDKKIKAAVVGATGYAGAELVRLLLTHPAAELTGISSVSFEGKELSEVDPNFKKLGLPTLTDEDTAIAGADVVFAGLPHGLSEPLAEKCAASGALLIDLGADFRLADEDEYTEWYKKPFDKPELHSGAVYALPELFRDEIKGAKSGTHRFNYVKPGDVRVGVLEDKNNNGVWDTGNLI
jgi:N-acetyl-gamma-glutamyl-phosphate reductase